MFDQFGESLNAQAVVEQLEVLKVPPLQQR